jgi:hypothetical protein
VPTGRAYKSDKRRKETARIKKQEEKRQRRFGLKPRPEEVEEGAAPEETSEVAEGQGGTEKVE